MDPLETLFRPLTLLMNRQIAVTTPARDICQAIEGSIVAVRVEHSPLAIYFHIHESRIALSGEYVEDPDVVISGSLLSLARLATSDAAESIRDGSVSLHGDARIAQEFQRLLRYGKPDVEEELSQLIGDSAAHNVSEFARQVQRWASSARATMEQNVGEYLQEESRAVPSRYEVDAFRDAVNVLRDDVARFEVRLQRAEAARSASNED